jgi:hypothetical protein
MAPPLVVPKNFKQMFILDCVHIDPSIIASISMNMMLLLLI